MMMMMMMMMMIMMMMEGTLFHSDRAGRADPASPRFKTQVK